MRRKDQNRTSNLKPYKNSGILNLFGGLKNKGMDLKISFITLAIFTLFAFSCNKQWDEHYSEYPETVDKNVWDALNEDPQLSKFVEILKEYQLDTLFQTNVSYTLVAPTNDAIDQYEGVNVLNDVKARYHIFTHFINSGSIQGKRKVQTLTEKFALFERDGYDLKIDGIEVSSQSPLFLNGRYFIVDEVVEPKPSLYEYYDITNPILGDYIDSQDTIILDKEKSRPLGFDEDGNTIYDTVSTIENKFEWEYFPVKQEFRDLTGTLVFPLEEDYNAALDIVADELGSQYVDHSDIPLEWQNEILLPHLFSQGMNNRNNQSKAVLHRWRVQGQDEEGMFHKAQLNHPANNLGSDKYVEEGDYLRLNNVKLSYRLSKNLCNKIGVRKANFAISARKLLTFTRYSGQDPEIGQNFRADKPFEVGRDYARTPPPRIITFSLGIGF